jgi:hypothetical protein
MPAPEHREWSRKIRVQIPQADSRNTASSGQRELTDVHQFPLCIPGTAVITPAHMMSMTTQLTFQGLLDAFAAVPQDAIAKISGFGSADTPGVLFRHRPFTDGLAITPTITRPALDMTVAELIDFLKESGPNRTWRSHGHNGFIDRYPAGPNTPMWVGTPHEVSFNAVTGLEIVKGFAVIRSTNLAPVQGPILQRIPDEEAINRLRVANLGLRGVDIHFSDAAERYLIRHLPKNRTDLLLRLDDARKDLTTFEASLQEKKDLVTKLELDAARTDYLLGIRDDLPGAEPGCNGICTRASDVGVSVPGDPVAYAHESCPEHEDSAI